MKNKMIKILSSAMAIVAVTAVSTATWLIFEQPSTPDVLR